MVQDHENRLNEAIASEKAKNKEVATDKGLTEEGQKQMKDL